MQSFVWGKDLSGTEEGAGGVGGLMSMTIHSGTNAGTYVYNYDGNGNVVALVNVTDGTIAAAYEYGPFGEPTRGGRTASENQFGFSTKYIDNETGSLYYGYRYYNPSTGRWLSGDPLAEDGGINVYAMLSNDSISMVDLLGLNAVPGSYPLIEQPSLSLPEPLSLDINPTPIENLPPPAPSQPVLPPANSCGGTLKKLVEVNLSWEETETRTRVVAGGLQYFTLKRPVSKPAIVSYESRCDEGGGGAMMQNLDVKWKSGNTTPFSPNGQTIGGSIGPLNIEIGGELTISLKELPKAVACAGGTISKATAIVKFVDKSTLGISLPIRSASINGPSTGEKVIAASEVSIEASCCCCK